MDDLISRQSVKEWLKKWEGYIDQDTIARMQYRVIDIPSAQPELTDEQAIDHLLSTGWMQNNDRKMYEMGLKKQLMDDSGSYEADMRGEQDE